MLKSKIVLSEHLETEHEIGEKKLLFVYLPKRRQ